MCRRNLSARPSKYSDYLSLRQNYSALVPNCFSCVDFSTFFPVSSVAYCCRGSLARIYIPRFQRALHLPSRAAARRRHWFRRNVPTPSLPATLSSVCCKSPLDCLMIATYVVAGDHAIQTALQQHMMHRLAI